MRTKRLLLLLTFLVATTAPLLAQGLTFSFTAEASMNATLRNTAQKRITQLLNEINNAQRANRPLNFQGISIEATARKRLEMLWADMHFYCEDNVIVARPLEDAQGYQVRDIAITMVPVSAGYNGDTARDLVISFDRRGFIMSVTPATGHTSYTDIMKNGQDIADARRRREIVKFVEEYFAYYEAKDIQAIENIFSDDALIITGCVTMRRAAGDIIRAEAQVRYKKQNKGQYIANLRSSFARNKYIKIDIEDIKVHRNGAKPNIYGVTLRQKYHSSTYSDDGYVFLLWDFTNEKQPKIHVRTWQPTDHTRPQDIFNEFDFSF